MRDIAELVIRYELANQAAGKSPKTVDWYTQMLQAFGRYLIEYKGNTHISLFTVDIAREYIIYLHTRPKFLGHRFTPAQGKGLSIEAIRGHIRALKAFSTWLQTEGHIRKNAMQKLKMLKAPTLFIQPLTEEEINTILKTIDQRTPIGQRNYVIVILLLDTGLRESEVADAILKNLDLKEGSLKVIGKGSKERIVPIGTFVQAALTGYINHVRPVVNKDDSENLFLADDGKPITANTLKLLFSRLKKKTGINRLHVHLCRHTFAINYLLNGGDIFSLKEILGHTTIEMVNRYLHFTKAQITARHHEFSPMDRFKSNPKKDHSS
jgi:site-specific recombinase XerD